MLRPVYDPSTQFLDPSYLPSPIGDGLMTVIETLFRLFFGG